MSPAPTRPCTAFDGFRRIAAGPLERVALAVRAWLDGHPAAVVLVFDDATGRVIDLDPRGSEAEVLARLPNLLAAFAPPADEDAVEAPAGPRGRGRPRLGVVAREVTLLPRHWAWLAGQPGGASVALRKLVDQARRENAGEDAARRAGEAAYRAMSALAGDLPGFEDASRALFAHDTERFAQATASWPKDLRDYIMRLALRTVG